MIPNFVFEFAFYIYNLDTGNNDYHPSIEIKVAIPSDNRHGRYIGTRNFPFAAVNPLGFPKEF